MMKPALARLVFVLCLGFSRSIAAQPRPAAAPSAPGRDAPSSLPPVPRQAVRTLGMFQSAYSMGDVARALNSSVPASQLNDIDPTTSATALTFLIGADIPPPVERFLVNRLLSLGAHPNAPDARHNTPLSEAVRAGRPELVRLLLSLGVPVNDVPAGGQHVLFRVCDVRDQANIPNELAARTRVFELLVAHGADLAARFGGPGTRYPARGPLDDCDVPGFEPLSRRMIAAGMRYVRADLAGRNAGLPTGSPVNAVTESGRSDAAPAADHTALFVAIARGDAPAVQRALASGPAVTAMDRASGTYPLTWIAYHPRVASASRERIAALILDRGANVDAVDEYGTTALRAANAAGWSEGARVLVARGARPSPGSP